MPEQGDWYARGMYMEGRPQYESISSTSAIRPNMATRTSATIGDRPMESEELMSLYVEMGALRSHGNGLPSRQLRLL